MTKTKTFDQVFTGSIGYWSYTYTKGLPASKKTIIQSDLESAVFAKFTPKNYARLLRIWDEQGQTGVARFIRVVVKRCLIDLIRAHDRHPVYTALDAPTPKDIKSSGAVHRQHRLDLEEDGTPAAQLTEQDYVVDRFPYQEAKELLSDLQYDGLVNGYTVRELEERYETSKSAASREIEKGRKILSKNGITKKPRRKTKVVLAHGASRGLGVMAQTQLHPEHIKPEVLESFRATRNVKMFYVCEHAYCGGNVGANSDPGNMVACRQFDGSQPDAHYALCESCWQTYREMLVDWCERVLLRYALRELAEQEIVGTKVA